MPAKNTRKSICPNSYYHVYNRGINKLAIFEDTTDIAYLYKLFSRYLDPHDTQTDYDNHAYKKICSDIEIQSFCIMPNHYHLLIHVNEKPSALSDLMQRIWTTYTGYYNNKYQRVGPLFQDRYKASLITSEEHLFYISRYIHLNPIQWETYPYSSVTHFLDRSKARMPKWFNSDRLNTALNSIDYKNYLLGGGQASGLAS